MSYVHRFIDIHYSMSITIYHNIPSEPHQIYIYKHIIPCHFFMAASRRWSPRVWRFNAAGSRHLWTAAIQKSIRSSDATSCGCSTSMNLPLSTGLKGTSGGTMVLTCDGMFLQIVLSFKYAILYIYIVLLLAKVVYCQLPSSQWEHGEITTQREQDTQKLCQLW